MSHQTEHEHPLSQTVTSEEQRQSLLTGIEASQQAITELSDEELEEIAGGEEVWHDMYKQIDSLRGMGTSSLVKHSTIETGVHIIVGTALSSLINNYSGSSQSSSNNQQ